MGGSNLEGRAVLVTGVAGFIGFHLANRLLAAGACVIGIDSVNAYYDVALKEARLRELASWPAFRFKRCDIRAPMSAPMSTAFWRFSRPAALRPSDTCSTRRPVRSTAPTARSRFRRPIQP